MKLILLLGFLFAASPALAEERWMWCGQEKVWIDDSEAQVVMKCGRPNRILYTDPQLETIKEGNREITRTIRRTIYLYPGYDTKYYYLEFENSRLISIKQEYLGDIPRR